MEITRKLSKQQFPTGSGRITLKNSLGDYLHLLKSPDFRLLVFKCAGSYSRVFTVFPEKNIWVTELPKNHIKNHMLLSALDSIC